MELLEFLTEFRPHHDPEVDPASNRYEYLKYLLGGGGKRKRGGSLNTRETSKAQGPENEEP